MSSGPHQGVAPSSLQADLGRRIKQFLLPAGGSTLKISKIQPVASYSWIDAKTPTIAVPGAPPCLFSQSRPFDNTFVGSPRIWRNVDVVCVPKDAGLVFIDQNAYHMGSTASSLTPIFSAIDEFVGKYEFNSLDLVSDRNTLWKLFRWVTGSAEDFRIDLEVAGKTCLFTRWESRDADTIEGFVGFGREYEKASTTLPPGCERATGHHRIISMVRSCTISLVLKIPDPFCHRILEG
jgi:hypothetical protein